MKNYKYLLLVSTCLLFNNNSVASELDLTFNSSSLPFGISTTLNTHTPNVELKPISNFTKFAAVCAIANGGCDGMGFNSGNNDINLDNAAQCKDEGFGTSCPSGYVPDTSQKCPYNSSFYKCRVCSHSCSSGSLAYCNSNQIETGSSRNDCNETCYTCRAKTCDDGGYSSSINSCQKATTVSFAGKTCYTSVSAKNCADGGYSASIPTNQTCSSTSYCGNTCYHSCSQPACSAGGYLASCPANHSCTTTSYYGRTCYKDCVNSCVPYSNETGCSYGTTSCSNGCGGTRTCCVAKPATCEDSGYSTKRKTPIMLWTCNPITINGLSCYDCYGNTSRPNTCSGGGPGTYCSCGGSHRSWSPAHVCISSL